MKITQKYSHLNGEEYLIVHHNDLYDEIKEIIESIDAEAHRTKISKEKRKVGNRLFAPKVLNKTFKTGFNGCGWEESRYSYFITLERELMEKSILMPAKEQRKFLVDNGEDTPIHSFNQTDFVKDRLRLKFSLANMRLSPLTYSLNICCSIRVAKLIFDALRYKPHLRSMLHRYSFGTALL